MKKITSPVKAIRAKCLDCCCDQANEVKLCPCDDCPLHAFRFGRNPFRYANMTDEQKAKLSERGAKLAAKRKADRQAENPA